MSAGKSGQLTVNGWSLFAHPLFLTQLGALEREVESRRRKDPRGYRASNPAKRLAAITRLAFEIIPQDPTRPDYRQGSTLDADHRHWYRAKFFQRYRLFFRFHAASRIIVYAWADDEHSLRGYGNPDDVYVTFRRMLERGRPPDDWDRLLAEAHRAQRR